MNKHEFVIGLAVDEAALAEYNERAETTGRGILLGDDPSDWNLDELLEAIKNEIAVGDVVDYNAL